VSLNDRNESRLCAREAKFSGVTPYEPEEQPWAAGMVAGSTVPIDPTPHRTLPCEAPHEAPPFSRSAAGLTDSFSIRLPILVTTQ
jgi:hypothetical protein